MPDFASGSNDEALVAGIAAIAYALYAGLYDCPPFGFYFILS